MTNLIYVEIELVTPRFDRYQTVTVRRAAWIQKLEPIVWCGHTVAESIEDHRARGSAPA